MMRQKAGGDLISIFVCDDDRRYLDMLTKCIQDYIIMKNLELELALSTTDPGEIIQLISRNKVNGLYFLDIELKGGYNGVDVGRSIRKYDPRGFIVFITSHSDYLPLTFEYKIEALDYIKKTDDENAIRQKVCGCIKDAYDKHISYSEDRYFTFKLQNGGQVSCEHQDILFIETDPEYSKRVILHTKKRQYVFYGSLRKLSKQLPKRLFFQCHQSFMVNLDNISEIAKTSLNQGNDKFTMQNGAQCFVSARKRNELLRLIDDFDA